MDRRESLLCLLSTAAYPMASLDLSSRWVGLVPRRVPLNTTGNLRLIDGNELVGLIYKHYDVLAPRYKGIIPLKQVDVPESVEPAAG